MGYWANSSYSAKAHYFEDRRSLCHMAAFKPAWLLREGEADPAPLDAFDPVEETACQVCCRLVAQREDDEGMAARKALLGMLPDDPDDEVTAEWAEYQAGTHWIQERKREMRQRGKGDDA